jgi:hypothetical protein
VTGSKNRSAPPPPSSNRTCRFPASGFPKNTSLEGMHRQSRLGQRAETLPRNEVGRSLFWEQRSMCILTLLHAEFLAGLLGSAGVTPLPRYYEPNRLPFEPRRSYEFPRPVDGAEVHRHSNGSLRFLTTLSASAIPSHPGELNRCTCSLLHDR